MRYGLGRAGLGALVLGLGLYAGGTALADSVRSGPPAPASWITYSPASKAVTLRLVGAYNNVAYGYNFDGYAFGSMTVRIPLGWHVHVVCTNSALATVSHSCAVVRRLTDTRPAIPHADSHAPVEGLPPGDTDTFDFVASRPGRYRLACIVTGHPETGMWDTLRVTRDPVPSVRVK